VLCKIKRLLKSFRYRPTLADLIDDDWRRERFADLDIILSTKIVQSKLNAGGDGAGGTGANGGGDDEA